MNIKGIIFDLDGTLIDSIQFIADHTNKVLLESGFSSHPLEDYRKFIGHGIINLAKRVLPKEARSATNIEDITEKIRLQMQKEAVRDIKPFPNIEILLKKLNELNIKLGVLSNKDDHLTKSHMKELFPEIPFISVYGATSNTPLKPDPFMVHKILKEMDIDHHSAIMVGDMQADIETGKNAGIKTMAVLWGFGRKEDLASLNPNYMADSPLEVLDLI